MKNALLATSLLVCAIAAYAQSSVTLYGRLDAGIEYMSGLTNAAGSASTSRWRVEGGDWGTSLWGLKGVEDIGNGNKVLFQLENGFNAVNGNLASAGSLWSRWATVGVANDSFGTLLLGRELFISNGLWDFDPLGQSNWSSASLVRGRNWPISSNNISYQSPKIAGFDAYGQYSLSNGTSWNANPGGQGRSDGIQLTYTSALFQVRGLYDEIHDPNNGLLDNVFTASREYFVGANVFLGQFKLQGVYQASRISGITSSVAGTPTTTNQFWGGLTWQATPAAALIAAAYHV
ncbi:Outer membrane protein (porin) [Burkholderia sp. OK233]|nr:Outer membrane protein (porin) [Burkholderia sp. OK233]